MKLVLASDNKGKLREFGALFADHGIEVVSQGSLGVTPCEEPYGTFLENALAKARNAAKATGLAAMADDSGITAHALVCIRRVTAEKKATMRPTTRSS